MATIERLRAIWVDVLNVRTIADRDSFVDLGGDSIAGTLCVNRIESDFGLDVPMAVLFDDGMTLERLSAEIDRSLAAPIEDVDVAAH